MSSLTPAEIFYEKAHASDNLQPNMIAIDVCGIVLPYIAVILRFITRKKSAVLGMDDWLIFAALFPLTGYSIASGLAIHFGEGRHIIFLQNARSYVEAYIAIITTYALCIILTKISILYFYNRIFPSSGLLRTSWAIAITVVLYNVALVLITALECIPLSTIWTRKPGKCIETRPTILALAVVNVATDAIILGLPMKYVWTLRMRTVRKVQICGIFLLGAIVCVFGVIRTVEIATAPEDDQTCMFAVSFARPAIMLPFRSKYLLLFTEQVDTVVHPGIWSHAEMSVGVVAACLPTLSLPASRKIILPAASSSIRRIISTIWRALTRSSAAKSSNMTEEFSISDLPSRRGFKIYPDVEAPRAAKFQDVYRGYTNYSSAKVTGGSEDSNEERSFARSKALEFIYREDTFTVAECMANSKEQV